MAVDTDIGPPTVILSAIAGIAAWGGGYLGTYLIVGPNIRESALNQILEAFDGDPAVYELVGWVFYNAHFVDILIQDLPIIGTRTVSYVGGENGFTVVLYGLPIVLLAVAGFGIAWYHGSDGPIGGAIDGLLLTPWYMLLMLLGVVLFEISVGEARAAPDLVMAFALAGVVYPLVFGGIGGSVAGTIR